MGLLLRPRNGIYCLPSTQPAAIEALSHRGVLACATAARDIGLWTLDDGVEGLPHVWVSPQHHPTRFTIDPDTGARACCVFHRDLTISHPSLTRVGLLDCLVQILGCQGVESFFVALESALRKDLLTASDRRRLVDLIPAAHRWLVDLARDDADSGLESLLRLRLHRHGLSLARQVPIPGVGVVDFVIGDCLILEADGETHGGDNRHRDLVRDSVAMRLGFVTLRFDYAMIVHEWELVEEAILAAIRRNLHRSVAGLTW